MKARMPGQPALHFRMLMRGVVIADQVQLSVGGDGDAINRWHRRCPCVAEALGLAGS
jgi:hypothetical protein